MDWLMEVSKKRDVKGFVDAVDNLFLGLVKEGREWSKKLSRGRRASPKTKKVPKKPRNSSLSLSRFGLNTFKKRKLERKIETLSRKIGEAMLETMEKEEQNGEVLSYQKIHDLIKDMKLCKDRLRELESSSEVEKGEPESSEDERSAQQLGGK
jgi:hypothetical protein